MLVEALPEVMTWAVKSASVAVRAARLEFVVVRRQCSLADLFMCRAALVNLHLVVQLPSHQLTVNVLPVVQYRWRQAHLQQAAGHSASAVALPALAPLVTLLSLVAQATAATVDTFRSALVPPAPKTALVVM
jgi:hypothetical protein